ncbi:MAG TPA: ABC transporter substrate-binding protein [Anaeromyxobacteraceae bacterium]|nr:ABC transporter substrate-binding protein [Anaeromyxobacteraceae bacterium]
MAHREGADGGLGRAATTAAIVLSALVAPVVAGAESVAPRGIAPDEIVLGMTAPFSGSAKELSRHWRTGWELAFSLVNEQGGINGRRVRLVALHDGNDPKKALLVAKELLEKHRVFAMVGNVGTASTSSFLEHLLEEKVLLYCPLTGGKHVRSDPPDRYVFNCRTSYAEEVSAAVRYLVEVRRIKPSQMVILTEANGYGEAGYKGFASQLRRYRRDPGAAVRVSYVPSATNIDEAVRVVRANAKRLRAAVMVGHYRQVSKFIEKTRDLDLIYTSVSEVGAQTLGDDLLQIGPRFTENLMVTEPGPLPTSHASAVLKYQELLKKYAPSERPNFLSLQSYLAGLVFAEALKRAGRDLTTETVVDALEGLKGLDVGIGVPVGFSPSEHQAWHKVWGVTLLHDGSWKQVELE